MSYSAYTDLFIYPTLISNAQLTSANNLNNIVEGIRLANAGIRRHQHTGIVNDGVIISTTGILNQSIITSLIPDYAVTTDKLDQTVGGEAVSTATMRDEAVTNAKVNTSAMTDDKFVNYSVTPIKLQNGVAIPLAQTYYGKDVNDVLGFNTLGLYATSMANSGNTLVLNNNATVLSSITIPYATNVAQLGGQDPDYYRCTTCSWTCTGLNAPTYGKIN